MPKTYTVKVTAQGIVFPASFHAAALAMQRRRVKKPEMKEGEVQLTLEYGENENA